MALAGDGSSAFSRALASNSRKQRDAALFALTQWLGARTSVEESDLMKIWKGQFYAMWHADKAPVQAEVAESMAAVLDACQPEVALAYLEACVLTLRREWPVIDRLRLDKYMVLVRRMLFHAFQFLARHQWSDELLLPVCEFLRTRLLLATDHGSSLGLALHVSDVLLAELAAAAAHTGCPLHALPTGTLLAVLQPFMAVLSTPGHATLAQRAVSALFEPLVETLRDGAEGDNQGDAAAASTPRLSLEQGQAVAQALFDTASDPGTSNKHRSLLYQLSRRFKEAASDGPVEKRPRKGAAGQPKAQTPKDAPVVDDAAKRGGKRRDHLLGGSIVVPTSEYGGAEADGEAAAVTPADAPARQRGTPQSGLTPVSGHSSAYETALSHGASGRSLENGDGSARLAPSTGKGRGKQTTPSAALEGSFEDVWVTPPASAGGAHAGLQSTPRRTPGTPTAAPGSALASGKRKAQQQEQQQHQAAPAAVTPGSGQALSSPAKRIKWALKKNELFTPVGLPHTEAGRSSLHRQHTPKSALRLRSAGNTPGVASAGARGGTDRVTPGRKAQTPNKGGAFGSPVGGGLTPQSGRVRAVDFFS